MTQSRRTFFASASAAGTALVAAPALLSGLAAPALAKTPIVGSNGPSFYRFKLGEFEVTALHEGEFTRPLDDKFIRNVPFADVQKFLSANLMPTDKITISFTALLVNTGSQLVLLDTGFNDNGGATNGKVVAALKAAGVEPAQIDKVVISHFHADHISGIRAKNGQAIYPNAEILVPEPEWAFWMDDARMNAAPEAARGGFMGARRVFSPVADKVKRFKWGEEIMTGITAVDASGHTPGHTAFVLASGNQKLMYVADTTNNPLIFAANPDWQLMFDMDADKAVATRKRLLDMATADKLQLSFYHASFPATGFVAKESNGYRFLPVQWS